MSRRSLFSLIPAKKWLSALLITTLLISQTVRFDMWDSVSAGPEAYSDVVSIIVDTDTYRAERSRIQRYAEDIAGAMGSTRTNIVVVSPGTPPSVIATRNEKLYYEGDGDKGISALVGTVLIGNVPIPMVKKDGYTFPSLYPYVDFVDKAFVYNSETQSYEHTSTLGEQSERAEVWHGVINPAVGRAWSGSTDIAKIGQFLDKTHERYTKQGVFALAKTPPKVFLYDGFNEAKSITKKSLFQYALAISTFEDISYNRYSKAFLKDINDTIKGFEMVTADPEIADFYTSQGLTPGSDTISADDLAKIPDIKTRDVIQAFQKNFKGIFNEKALGDELRFVHNAGRYNLSGSNVSVDLAPVAITLMDQVARDTLREVNTTLESQIDQLLLSGGYARRIAILDEVHSSYDGIDPSRLSTDVRQGYYFGMRSDQIRSPEQCTIARGSTGQTTAGSRGQLVEANVAFDVQSAESQLALLRTDDDLLRSLGKPGCFENSTVKIDSYWGGNSVLRATSAGSGFSVLDDFPFKKFTGFTKPILSLAGMRSSDRISVGSIQDCLPGGYGYLLPSPRTMTYASVSWFGDEDVGLCSTAYPSEWTRETRLRACPLPETNLGGQPNPRFTCASDVMREPDMSLYQRILSYAPPVPGVEILDFTSTYRSYTPQGTDGLACTRGNLYLDGKLITPSPSCAAGSLARNTAYHTISSLYKHVSPTQDELAAATKAQVTPSLAIDPVRYVEFVTPKGQVARLEYPNLHKIEGTTVASARAWLTSQSQSQWNDIIKREKEISLDEIGNQIRLHLSGGILPDSPIDWNQFLTDDTIQKLISARDWMHPDISLKYRQAIPALLSASKNFSSDPTRAAPPMLPSRAPEYEIAYLGIPRYMEMPSLYDIPSLPALKEIGASGTGAYGIRPGSGTNGTPYFPPGGSSSGSFSDTRSQYESGVKEIQALNISEQNNNTSGMEDATDIAAECGPPEGVALAKWPAAIMCWIEKQFPPKILPGSCGPTTIGFVDEPGQSFIPGNTLISSAPPIIPPISIVTQTGATRAFYSTARVIPMLEKSSIRPGESMTIKTVLIKGDTRLVPMPGTTVKLEFVSGSASGTALTKDTLKNYITISPEQAYANDNGANFIVTSTGGIANIILQAVYTIPTEEPTPLLLKSENIEVRITDEYYEIDLTQSGSTPGQIDSTNTSLVQINLKKSTTVNPSGAPASQVKVEVWDDVTGVLVMSGTSLPSTTLSLPDSITRKTGVYRIRITDSAGVQGELTFAVSSGPLAQIRLSPVSSAVVRGNSTIVLARLVDRLGQPITPDVHNLKVTVEGGYIMDAMGTKRSSLDLSIMENATKMTIGSDALGKIIVRVSTDPDISATQEITVYDSARLVLSRGATPKVGGSKIPMTLQIQDGSGKRMTGVSGVASWIIPDGAGSFSKEIITITDGLSEPFDYLPGTKAGDHHISISVLGIGTLNNLVFSVLSGDPMYIDHSIEGGQVIFALRDRYRNIVSTSLQGTISRNGGAATTIGFDKGRYRMPLQGGYYIVDVPAIANSSITYKDSSGIYTIRGISRYATYIRGDMPPIDFAPDYNARYTVLAGGSYLREAEDILFGTLSGKSQSLAATTSLEDPYADEVIFSIVSGGGYHLPTTSTYAPRASITLRDSYPLLTVTDEVSNLPVASVLYRMDGADLQTCSPGTCTEQLTRPTIRMRSTVSDIAVTSSAGAVTLSREGVALISVRTDGSVSLTPAITLVPVVSPSKGLHMQVLEQGLPIGEIVYTMDLSRSVERSETVTPDLVKNTPVLIGNGYSTRQVWSDTFAQGVVSYDIINPSGTPTLNRNILGPDHTDDLAGLEDTPGIGWQENNTMLLAYAAGDSVGEANKHFHTYTLINMGDPVTDIDHNRIGTEIDGVDRAVGSIITRATQGGISEYYHRDLNADGLEDLVTLSQENNLELFLNLGGKFHSRGMIAYIPEIQGKSLQFGDFIKDGYADIVGLDREGHIIIMDNDQRRFTRRSIQIEGSGALTTQMGQITVTDLDRDGRDDIVALSVDGVLSVLYGTMTAGVFTQKIIDSSLGARLGTGATSVGGAVTTNQVPQIPNLGSEDKTNTGVTDTRLKAEAFYNYRTHTQPTIPDTLSGAFDQIATTPPGTKTVTYVKSQYAPAYGMTVEKRFSNLTNTNLRPGDRIQVKISIKNTSGAPQRSLEYLDTISPIFSAKNTKTYTVTLDGQTVTRDFEYISNGDYDAHFYGLNIPSGKTLDIIYELVANAANYGKIVIKNNDGSGNNGSNPTIGFESTSECGGDQMTWTASGDRTFIQGTQTYGGASLPSGVGGGSALTDANGNGIPDATENMSISERQALYDSMNGSQKDPSIIQARVDTNTIEVGFDPGFESKIEDMAQNLMDGLACGFGGGSCMSFPINWAPLAPGSAPTVFGIPMYPLTPNTGYPIFSALTGIQGYCGVSTCCIPSVYPVSPLGFVPGPTCGLPSAGGYLGTWAPSNVFRVFVTPTLTLGVGTAICFGGPAIQSGNTPMPGLSPFIQGGNCIVAAKALPVCKGDGSSADGDVTNISGLGTDDDTWNSQSCTVSGGAKDSDPSFTQNIVDYLKEPNSARLGQFNSQVSRRGSIDGGGSLLKVGSRVSGGTEIDIEVDSNTRVSDIGSVVKIKNKRIAAFPDFMMEWLTRQTEEIVTSLFTPPNLTIIPPTDFGQNAQIDSTFEGFWKKLGAAYSKANMDNLRQSMVETRSKASPQTPAALQGAQANLNALKTAYTFIGKLPFVRVRQVNIPINIPWVKKNELDRYQRTLQGYQQELAQALANWCVSDPSKECLDQKARLNTGPLISSINENLRRIEEYKRFPIRLQKYISWKERYITQILCNIDSIQQITTGWLRDNGIRFRKWAELYVLIKAIAESWQPIIDIFADTSASCGVCRNERYNSQYWKFKLISMLIPDIPVIKFPKWPDIILDLSDVRLGIDIALPTFDMRLSPLRLPSLPGLSIGTIKGSLTLPSIPILPKLPDLPDLPDLPSLPRIKLPDLPPPPKLPKLAGAIQTALKIMKLIAKMYCYYQKTALVPEWQAGDVIAQRTERQGTLPFDFLDLNFPQFSLPTLREIRVSTHVNFELRSDFIAEFARSAVRPLNRLKTDIQLGIPSKIGTDVGIPDQTINVNLQSKADPVKTSVNEFVAQMESEKDIFLEIDEFRNYLTHELDLPEFAQVLDRMTSGLKKVAIESKQVESELLTYNQSRFSTLKTSIQREAMSNSAKLQNIIDLLQDTSNLEARELVADQLTGAPSTAFDTFDQIQERTLPSESRAFDVGLDAAKKSLDAGLKRVAQSTTSTTLRDSSAMPGYAPNYQGIYVMTPISRVQTRLFDYLDPITPDTHVETLDIDKDGDKDYIYMMGDTLYVKYSHLKEPKKNTTTSIKVTQLDQKDNTPYVPDFFYSDVDTSQSISFSYAPTHPSQHEWRLDIYDRYIQWDQDTITSRDPQFAPRSTVDLFTDTWQSPTSQSDTPIESLPAPRILQSVGDRNSFVLKGRQVDIYTGSLSLSISPGRVLYTSDKSIKLYYTPSNSDTERSIVLDPNTGYRFDESLEIRTDGPAKIYLIGDEDGSRTAYSDDLIGLPLLPGMQMYSEGTVQILDRTHGHNIRIEPYTIYTLYDVGPVAGLYQVNIPWLDGMYYGRLQYLDAGKDNRTDVALFAPQKYNDRGAPVLDLPSTIRIPIYTTRTFRFADIITDRNATTLSIDGDVSQDTNGNGIYDDDFALSGYGYTITDESLTLGHYTAPGHYNLMVRVTDELGNTTLMPLVVEAYTPIPEIQSVTASGWISGQLDEPIFGEPIHFFRVRPFQAPVMLSPTPTNTDEKGVFNSGSYMTGSEVITYRVGAATGTITPQGVISIPRGWSLEMSPMNGTSPMRLILIDQSGSIQYTQIFNVPVGTPIIQGSGTLVNAAINVNSTDLKVVSATSQDPSIPGGAYLIDPSSQARAAITREGHILLIDPSLTLKYQSRDGHIVIQIVSGESVIAEVIYNLDFYYISK